MRDRGLRFLGVAAVLLFWVPLLAPLIQLAAFIEAVRAAWRGSARRSSLAIAAGGAGLGLALFLCLQYVWIV
ncbi:MAG: hypothetical protein ACRD5D_02205 [Candidatus Polarisedimenticolia bacterium]